MTGNNVQEGGRTLYTDKEYEKAQEWCNTCGKKRD